MNSVLFFTHYLIWHYTRAYRDMVALFLNFAWYITHLFSIPLLLRTLFSPWKRITAEHRKFDLEDFAEAVAFNLMSRVTGCVIRSVLILMGLCCLLLLTGVFFVVLLLWCFLPVLVVYAPLYGFALII